MTARKPARAMKRGKAAVPDDVDHEGIWLPALRSVAGPLHWALCIVQGLVGERAPQPLKQYGHLIKHSSYY